MRVKDVLFSGKTIQKKIFSLEVLRRQYERLADSVGAKPFDEPLVSKTRSIEAPFVKWIDKILAVDKEIDKLKVDLILANRLIMEAVEALKKTDYKAIIIARYISYLTWEQVCESPFISETTAKRWHYLAIEELEKMVRSKQIWKSLPKQEG